MPELKVFDLVLIVSVFICHTMRPYDLVRMDVTSPSSFQESIAGNSNELIEGKSVLCAKLFYLSSWSLLISFTYV